MGCQQSTSAEVEGLGRPDVKGRHRDVTACRTTASEVHALSDGDSGDDDDDDEDGDDDDDDGDDEGDDGRSSGSDTTEGETSDGEDGESASTDDEDSLVEQVVDPRLCVAAIEGCPDVQDTEVEEDWTTGEMWGRRVNPRSSERRWGKRKKAPPMEGERAATEEKGVSFSDVSSRGGGHCRTSTNSEGDADSESCVERARRVGGRAGRNCNSSVGTVMELDRIRMEALLDDDSTCDDEVGDDSLEGEQRRPRRRRRQRIQAGARRRRSTNSDVAENDAQSPLDGVVLGKEECECWRALTDGGDRGGGVACGMVVRVLSTAMGKMVYCRGEDFAAKRIEACKYSGSLMVASSELGRVVVRKVRDTDLEQAKLRLPSVSCRLCSAMSQTRRNCHDEHHSNGTAGSAGSWYLILTPDIGVCSSESATLRGTVDAANKNNDVGFGSASKFEVGNVVGGEVGIDSDGRPADDGRDGGTVAPVVFPDLQGGGGRGCAAKSSEGYRGKVQSMRSLRGQVAAEWFENDAGTTETGERSWSRDHGGSGLGMMVRSATMLMAVTGVEAKSVNVDSKAKTSLESGDVKCGDDINDSEANKREQCGRGAKVTSWSQTHTEEIARIPGRTELSEEQRSDASTILNGEAPVGERANGIGLNGADGETGKGVVRGHADEGTETVGNVRVDDNDVVDGDDDNDDDDGDDGDVVDGDACDVGDEDAKWRGSKTADSSGADDAVHEVLRAAEAFSVLKESVGSADVVVVVDDDGRTKLPAIRSGESETVVVTSAEERKHGSAISASEIMEDGSNRTEVSSASVCVQAKSRPRKKRVPAWLLRSPLQRLESAVKELYETLNSSEVSGGGAEAGGTESESSAPCSPTRFSSSLLSSTSGVSMSSVEQRKAADGSSSSPTALPLPVRIKRIRRSSATGLRDDSQVAVCQTTREPVPAPTDGKITTMAAAKVDTVEVVPPGNALQTASAAKECSVDVGEIVESLEARIQRRGTTATTTRSCRRGGRGRGGNLGGSRVARGKA